VLHYRCGLSKTTVAPQDAISCPASAFTA